MKRFIAFYGYSDQGNLDAAVGARAYLEYLVVEREVAPSTQNRALNALVFLYREVLRTPFGEMEAFVRAKRPQRFSEVMTWDEVETLFSKMEGLLGLIVGLMYESGLCLMEDRRRNQILVRDGKGRKDRVAMFPEQFLASFRDHIARERAIYEKDLSQRSAGVYIWPALEGKYPNSGKEWICLTVKSLADR